MKIAQYHTQIAFHINLDKSPIYFIVRLHNWKTCIQHFVTIINQEVIAQNFHQFLTEIHSIQLQILKYIYIQQIKILYPFLQVSEEDEIYSSGCIVMHSSRMDLKRTEDKYLSPKLGNTTCKCISLRRVPKKNKIKPVVSYTYKGQDGHQN